MANKDKGWREQQNESGKAPKHVIAANKKKTAGVSRVPMVRRESKWNEIIIIKELRNIMVEIGHFPRDEELRKLKRSDIATAIAEHGGLNKFRELLGAKIIKASSIHWTDELVLKELINIKEKIGHFPTTGELSKMRLGGLLSAITKFGGTNKFRILLGDEPLHVQVGYWTDKIIIEELKIILKKIGKFPKTKELQALKPGLMAAINKHGGMNKFRKLFGDEPPSKPAGYWTDETILAELEKIITETGHFPVQKELIKKGLTGMSNAISRCGGTNKFRELLGVKIIQQPKGFWNDEILFDELKKIKNKLGHFPTQKELKGVGRDDLRAAISIHGGIIRFRELFGEQLLHKPEGYWTNEKIIIELKKILVETGHFPSIDELNTTERGDLRGAIREHGGINKFRELLGEPLLKKPVGYWTDERILIEIKKAIDEIGHFPSGGELDTKGWGGLRGAISNHEGNIDYYRKTLGYPPSLEDFTGASVYNSRKGYKSEKEVKKLLLAYCNRINISEPIYYKKLSVGNVIEFVCGGRIGIDVTNARTEWSIRRKYFKKDYHKYLDKLWIVVLSDTFTNEDYLKFNEESPGNVEIMSIWDLIGRLQIDLDEHSRRKIEALETCTLRTKDDLINDLKNRTLSEYLV